MTDQAKKYLSDIIKAISLVEDFTKSVSTFETYQSSALIKSAVERQLGIIGEAVNQYRKLEESVELSAARRIVNFRNRIIHSYDRVDDTIVWAILQQHLPKLKTEVLEAIKS